MQLEEWIRKKKLTVAEFAKLMGCSRDIVYRWISRGTMPNGEYARRIEEVTGGEITFEQLRGNHVVRQKNSPNRV